MFYSLLLERSSPKFNNLILETNANIVYIRNSNFVLFILDEIIFRSLMNKNELKFVSIYTGFENMIKDTMIEVVSDVEDVTAVAAAEISAELIEESSTIVPQKVKEHTSNYLVSLKSHLNYWVYEELSPEGFYWKLKSENNPENTKNRNYYDLYYKTYPVVVEVNNTYFDQQIEVKHGPMIICSSELKWFYSDSNPKNRIVPYIFIKELFRDIVEIDFTNFVELGLKEGPNTHDLYLYYKSITHFDTEETERIVDTVINALMDKIQNCNFPRSVKSMNFETKKYLQQNRDGTYSLDRLLRDDLLSCINPYDFNFQLFTNFSSLENLYLFWKEARSFELEIRIENNDYASVMFYTRDLQKAIKMEKLMRVSKSLEPHDFKISLQVSQNTNNNEEFFNWANLMYMTFIKTSLNVA